MVNFIRDRIQYIDNLCFLLNILHDFVGRKTVLMADESLDKNHSELTDLDTKL